MSNGQPTRLTAGRPAHSRGFTLVEVLIAVAILSIGVIAALLIFPRGFDAFTETQQTYVALKQLDSILNDFQGNPDTLPDGIFPASASSSAINTFSFDDLYSVDVQSTAASWYTEHLYPGAAGPEWPLWQPASVRVLRKVVGEPCVIPSEFSSVNAVGTSVNLSFMPKYVPRFGPLQANGKWDTNADLFVPDAAGPLTVYDLRYRKVTAEKLNAIREKLESLPAGRQGLLYPDNLFYAVDDKANKLIFIPFRRTAPVEPDRSIRISFLAYKDGKIRHFCPAVIPLPALPDLWYQDVTSLSGTDDNTDIPFISIDQDKVQISVRGTSRDIGYELIIDPAWRLIAGSEQLNRAYAYYADSTVPETIQPDEDPTSEEFAALAPAQQDTNLANYLTKLANLPSGTFYMERMTSADSKGKVLLGAIYFSKADAGRAVKLDYTIADWNILHDDVTVDDQGYVRLSFPNPKVRNTPSFPREPMTWGLYAPMEAGITSTVMGLVDLRTGATYHAATDAPTLRQPRYYYYEVGDSSVQFPIDFAGAATGRVRLGGGSVDRPEWENLRGRTFRVFYRAQRDWTLQVYRAPAVFWRADGLSDSELCNGVWNKFSLESGNQIRVPAIYERLTVAVDYSYRQEVCRAAAAAVAGDTVIKVTSTDAIKVLPMELKLVNPGVSQDNATIVQVASKTDDTITLAAPLTGDVSVGAFFLDPNSRLLHVHGEEHTIPGRGKNQAVCRFNLVHLPAPTNTVTVRGLSVIVRALWIQPRSGKAWVYTGANTNSGLPLYSINNLRERWQAKTVLTTLPLAKD
ncbi:MAG: type IV pilus modification PilV family protein [Armatimonadota bacterium]